MARQTRGKLKRKPNKFDYGSTEFYDEIEDLASQGLTDKDIAWALVGRFGEQLTPRWFATIKNETDEKNNLTARASQITEALMRGRAKINLAVRSTYLKIALGGKVVSSTTRRKLITEDGDEVDSNVVQTTETELPPNLQALSTWLFNHDDEWREKTLEGKKLDITSGGSSIAPRKVDINVVYNKKEDLELQTKTDSNTEK